MTSRARWIFDALNLPINNFKNCVLLIKFCFFLALLSDKNKLWKKNWKELSREIHGIISPCRWLYPSINDMSSILVNPCKISPDSNAAWALILHNGRRCFRLNCFYASICMSIHMSSQWYLITVCIVKNFRGKISLFYRFLNVRFVHH